MADKFSEVKHTRVIIWGDFSGFWIRRAGWGGWRASEPGSSISERSVYLGTGASGMGPGHPAVAGVGASGRAEVCPDFGRRGDSGRLDRLIGNFAGVGGRVSLRPRFRRKPE